MQQIGYLKKFLCSAQKNYRRTKIHAILSKLNIFAFIFFKHPFFTYIVEFKKEKVGSKAVSHGR